MAPLKPAVMVMRGLTFPSGGSKFSYKWVVFSDFFSLSGGGWKSIKIISEF